MYLFLLFIYIIKIYEKKEGNHMTENITTFKMLTRQNLLKHKHELLNLNYDNIPYLNNKLGELFFFNEKEKKGYFYAMKPARWWRFVDMHLDSNLETILDDFMIEINQTYTKRNEALLEIQEKDELDNINYYRLVNQIINQVFFIQELPKPVLAKIFEFLFSSAKDDGDTIDVTLEYKFLKSITKEEVAYSFEDNLPVSFYNIRILITFLPLLKEETPEFKTDFMYKLLIILKNALLKEKQQIAAPFGYYYVLFISVIYRNAAYDDMTGYNLSLFNEIIPLLSQHVFRLNLFDTNLSKQINVLKTLTDFQNTFNLKVEIENYTEMAEKFLNIRKMLRLFDELS